MGDSTIGGGGGKKNEDGILLGKLLPSGLFCLLEGEGGGGGAGGVGKKKRSWESCMVNCYPSGLSWLLRISHFFSLDNIFLAIQ